MNPLYVLHPTLEHFRYLMRETMFLTWVFLATGFALAAIGLAWLRRTGQLVLRP